MEGLVARGTQRFSRLRSRLSREWNFQSRKTLRKFFKRFFFQVFWQLALATFSRLDLVAKNACFAFYGQFFKKLFEFSLNLFVTIHCLPCLNLFQNHSVHTQILIFSIFSIPLHQSSSKVMGSVSFSICVTYLVIYLLDCVFLLYI